MNYTSIEQSKKLLELGLSPESADICYQAVTRYSDPADGYYDSTIKRSSLDMGYEDDIPCWSVAALRNLIPVGIKMNDETVLFKNHNRIDKSWVYYFITESDNVAVQFTGSDLNAAYEMIVWLLENDYIEKGE